MNRMSRVMGQLSRAGVERKAQVSSQCTSCKSSSSLKKPVRVVVTGAAGNIAYSLVFAIARGYMLGDDQPIELRLLDIPQAEKALGGVLMELNDAAFPLLSKVVATSSYETAFNDVDVALLVGARPRGPGMVRADLLKANAAIFKGQGEALNRFASRNVKVLVVGNPANTNAMIAATYAPDLPKSAFTALTRLDLNRAKGQLAGRLGVNPSQVRNVIIWGNHSKTQYPDVTRAYVESYPRCGFRTPLVAMCKDQEWLRNDFIRTVQYRGAAVIKARGKSSAASAAYAAIDHMRSWWLGSGDEYVSMGVWSDGSYGVPKGIIYSFPCVCRNGKYEIVKGLQVDEFSREKMLATAKELVDEQRTALSLFKQ